MTKGKKRVDYSVYNYTMIKMRIFLEESFGIYTHGCTEKPDAFLGVLVWVAEFNTSYSRFSWEPSSNTWQYFAESIWDIWLISHRHTSTGKHQVCTGNGHFCWTPVPCNVGEHVLWELTSAWEKARRDIRYNSLTRGILLLRSEWEDGANGWRRYWGQAKCWSADRQLCSPNRVG